MPKIGSDIKSIKDFNRSLVLKMARKKPISRVEISRETGLTRAAVTIISNTLIEEGIIREIGIGQGDRGRHPIMIDLVDTYKYAVSIAISREEVTVCLVNLKCVVLDEKSYPNRRFTHHYEMLSTLIETIELLCKKNNIPKQKLLGIGISAPGPIDIVTGTILNPPNFSLVHNFAIVSLLREEFGKPVFIANNPIALAVAENAYGLVGDFKNALFIVVDDGIGVAIVSNGVIFRGAYGYAGEFGHLSVDLNGERCSCGNVGCLENYISFPSLKARFGDGWPGSWVNLVDNARGGDKRCREIIDFEVKYLSAAIVSVSNLLNIDAVVFQGKLTHRFNLIRPGIYDNVNSMVMTGGVGHVNILASTLPDAEKIAGAALVIEEFCNSAIS